MRAMRAPISCFTNKKESCQNGTAFLFAKKCTLYVKCIDIIRIMCIIYNHRKEINKSERW